MKDLIKPLVCQASEARSVDGGEIPSSSEKNAF